MQPLHITQAQYDEMLAHLQENLPEEACGLLAGKAGRVEKVMPITNQARSPVRFYMEPVELLNAFHAMDAEGLELMGIFHSHPNGPAVPSQTDLNEFLYPGTATVILSHSSRGWTGRAFDIRAGQYTEIGLMIQRNDD